MKRCDKFERELPGGTVDALEVGAPRVRWEADQEPGIHEVAERCLHSTLRAKPEVCREISGVDQPVGVGDPGHDGEPVNLSEHDLGEVLQGCARQAHADMLTGMRYALHGSCNAEEVTRQMREMERQEVLSDADFVLLSGLEAAMSESAQRGDPDGVPRYSWFLQVLVEQLIAALPSGSRSVRAVATFRDPQRGVTAKAMRDAAERLLSAGLIAPCVCSQQSLWTIPTDHRERVARSWPIATLRERRAVVVAAHRAVAVSEAWLKTRAISAEPRSSTSTSG